MFQQLLLAFVLAGVTVIIHAVATARVVMPVAGAWSRRMDTADAPGPILMLTRLVSGLLVLHLFEMIVWGTTFAYAGVLPDFEQALYYSLESYTTVGYGDVIAPPSRRLLGPIEAAVGVLMFGWSTGIIVAGVQRAYIGRPTA